MTKLFYISSIGRKALFISLFCCLPGFSFKAQAAADTTLFRIKVLQDTVYAGDTIDVEFYIGNESNPGGLQQLLNLNILSQFELEVATDTSRVQQDKTTFRFDQASLSAFFNTLFSNLQTSSLLNPVLGTLNMKAKSNKVGSGNARVGKGQYIVQDNAAGRQQMKFYFTKAISKGLLGMNNPVKVQTDSVFVIGKRKEPTPIIKQTGLPIKYVSRSGTPVTAELKIFPNPVNDYVHIEGSEVQQYRLMNLDGTTIVSADYEPEAGPLLLNMSGFHPGLYLLSVQDAADWKTFKIVKQ